MKTVIGLFERKDEAMCAYGALVADGYARADLDILTSDDRDDQPELARIYSWVPEPDVNIYLAGVRDGGTLVTANVADSAVARAASILGSFDMVNISERAADLSTKVTYPSRAAAVAVAPTPISAVARAARARRQIPAPATVPSRHLALTDPATNDNVLEVIEEDLHVGQELVGGRGGRSPHLGGEEPGNVGPEQGARETRLGDGAQRAVVSLLPDAFRTRAACRGQRWLCRTCFAFETAEDVFAWL